MSYKTPELSILISVYMSFLKVIVCTDAMRCSAATSGYFSQFSVCLLSTEMREMYSPCDYSLLAEIIQELIYIMFLSHTCEGRCDLLFFGILKVFIRLSKQLETRLYRRF